MVCFVDPRLRAASIKTNDVGVPLAASGRSAIVFRATAHAKDIALRCFTRAASDQRLRYQALHAHLAPTLPPYMVDFTYRDQEILVADTRYPLVEMGWAEGDPLDVWVGKHLGRGSDLGNQAAAWLAISNDMLAREIAHGDIANDNCLVSRSQLKLIDYDGCFIPKLAGKNPGEAGAQHFQHPDRSGHYAGDMDAFPSLVVYLSLLALQSDKSLWQFHTDRNLIFMAADYKAPRKTPIWDALAKSPDARVVSLANALANMCQKPITALPSIREVVAEAGIPLPEQRPGGTPAADLPSWGSESVLWSRHDTEAARHGTATPVPPATPSFAWLEDYLPSEPPSRTEPARRPISHGSPRSGRPPSLFWPRVPRHIRQPSMGVRRSSSPSCSP